MRKNKCIKAAINIALKSKCHVKHGCIIINNKGTVISEACNSYNYLNESHLNPPYEKGRKIRCSSHAEENALRIVNPKQLIGAKMYVVRVSSEGNTMLSKPCNRCTVICNKYMNNFGLRCVFYSED
jgi:tRNA(Arg) A34 adenosine deaminase TadA